MPHHPPPLTSTAPWVVGLDEVGRGSLAGSVVACAVACTGEKNRVRKLLVSRGVNDSKKLTSKRRKNLLEGLGLSIPRLKVGERGLTSFGASLPFALAQVDHATIDQVNILQASLRAMIQALEVLQRAEGFAEGEVRLLIDGPTFLPSYPRDCQTPMVKGDASEPLIALASLIAKEYRDHLMGKLAIRYPDYGFESHAGYPTKQHREALLRQGPCPIHRLSFRGCGPREGQKEKKAHHFTSSP